MGAKPLLSICIIFKNEMHCLERCLKSLTPLREAIPCELVMADTGATDGSREIAAQYADILIDFPWIKDFAAARNAVLDQSAGDWTLIIDCDEWIEDIEPLVEFLRSDKAQESSLVSVIIRNYVNLEDKSDFRDIWSARLMHQKKEKIRYVGAIHETPNGAVDTVIKFFFHHDGYAIQNTEADKIRNERNRELLQKELEKTPENLRCLIHCTQSADGAEELMQYAERIIAIVRKSPPDYQAPWRAAAFHAAIVAAYRADKLDTIREWALEGQKRFPESVLLRIDGNAYLALAEYQLKNWEKASECFVKWKLALEQYDPDKDSAALQIIGYSLNSSNPAWQTYIFYIMVETSCQEKNWEQAQEAIDCLTELPFSQNTFQSIVNVLLLYAENLDIAIYLKKQWDCLLQSKDIDEKNREALFQKMLETVSFRMNRSPKQTLYALAGMGACDLARSAQALISRDARMVLTELERIEDWKHILDAAIAHAVTLYVALPDQFFQQRSNDFFDLAILVESENKGQMASITLRYAEAEPYKDSILRILWLDNLVSVALFVADWSNADEGLALCKLFAQLEGDILTNIYRYEAIEEEDLLALPPTHQFGWRLCKGVEALERGDAKEYIRQLKAGVKAFPEMKKTVAFLSEHIDQMRPIVVTPEMQALAEQIQSILAQYAPDDPAVIALKQSPAYQKVAYLLKEEPTAEDVSVSSQSDKTSQKETVVPSVKSSVRSSSALDHEFFSLMEECSYLTIQKLQYRVYRKFYKLPAKVIKGFVKHFSQYPFYDKFRPDMKDFRPIDKKMQSLNIYANEYLWLYKRLEDFRSKKLLYAILRVWYEFDFAALDACIEHCFDDYFDPDILPCTAEEVVVDLGAYTGDTALSFVKTYGKDAYRRYYCYDASAAAMERCKKNTSSLPDMIYSQKGVGEKSGEMYLNVNSIPTLNWLSAAGDEKVSVVSLDEDIAEPITLLKMDIEGMEPDAIRGAARHIKNDRPKMAIAVYHNNEDLWQIPRMIDELCPNCRFYLRYHGGNAWPTEITFFAIPNES